MSSMTHRSALGRTGANGKSVPDTALIVLTGTAARLLGEENV